MLKLIKREKLSYINMIEISTLPRRSGVVLYLNSHHPMNYLFIQITPDNINSSQLSGANKNSSKKKIDIKPTISKLYNCTNIPKRLANSSECNVNTKTSKDMKITNYLILLLLTRYHYFIKILQRCYLTN